MGNGMAFSGYKKPEKESRKKEGDEKKKGGKSHARQGEETELRGKKSQNQGGRLYKGESKFWPATTPLSSSSSRPVLAATLVAPPFPRRQTRMKRRGRRQTERKNRGTNQTKTEEIEQRKT